MSKQTYRVLLIDDDPLQVSLVGRTLRGDGFQMRSTDSALGVTNTLRAFQPDIVLIALHISELPGDQLLMQLRRNTPSGTLLILYSAIDPDKLQALATSVQADGWISNNDEIGKLAEKLRALLTKESGRPLSRKT